VLSQTLPLVQFLSPPQWILPLGLRFLPTPVRSTRSADRDGDSAPRPPVQVSSHGDMLKAEVVFNL